MRGKVVQVKAPASAFHGLFGKVLEVTQYGGLVVGFLEEELQLAPKGRDRVSSPVHFYKEALVWTT